MANIYDVGDSVRLAVSFTKKNVLTDPSTVTVKVQDESGAESDYTYALAEVTKDGTGQYHKDIYPDKAGTWYYRWEGTGPATAAEEKSFILRATEF